jgi:hypothetical protein
MTAPANSAMARGPAGGTWVGANTRPEAINVIQAPVGAPRPRSASAPAVTATSHAAEPVIAPTEPLPSRPESQCAWISVLAAAWSPAGRSWAAAVSEPVTMPVQVS